MKGRKEREKGDRGKRRGIEGREGGGREERMRGEEGGKRGRRGMEKGEGEKGGRKRRVKFGE